MCVGWEWELQGVSGRAREEGERPWVCVGGPDLTGGLRGGGEEGDSASRGGWRQDIVQLACLAPLGRLWQRQKGDSRL